jgi:hypothetical protein
MIQGAIPTVIRDFTLLQNVQISFGSTQTRIQWVPGLFTQSKAEEMSK